MPPTGAEYWAAQNTTQYQTPIPNRGHHNHRNQLNPSVSSFHPTGTEMTRFQGQPPPTPPFSTPGAPNEMVQMHNHMVHNHFIHTKSIASLERKTEETHGALEKIKEVVGSDMRELQDQILELKEQMAAQAQQQAGMLVRRPLADQDLTPPDEFLQNFSKERIAEVYIAEAEDFEATAVKLREQAEEICSGVGVKKPNTSTMLRGLVGNKKSDGEVEFACCGVTYASMRELLDHVGDQHGLRPLAMKEDMTNQTNADRDGDVTPTHIPPRRPKAPKEEEESHAIQIKTPDDVKEMPACQTDIATQTEVPQQREPSNQWTPLHVRQMSPQATIANFKGETFSFDFLRQNLGGEEWSPGFYFIKETTREKFLPIKSYWLLEDEFEPLLPSDPGQHGAKLTAFFNETVADAGHAPGEEEYLNVPVFICQSKEVQGSSSKEYVYFGHYSQNRYSDRLDVDHILENIPETVLRHHAEELASVGRPEWVTKALMDHFFPMPKYEGVLPTNSQVNTPKTEVEIGTDVSGVIEKHVMEDLVDYAEDLKEWEKDARLKVSLLTTENLMKAFKRPDAGGEGDQGLRLWLEYFEFARYDEGIVNFLVKVKENPQKYPVKVERGGVEQSTRKKIMGGKMVSSGNGVETLRPTSFPVCSNGPAQQRKANDAAIEKKDQGWDTESRKTAINTATKNHIITRKPWEENAKKAQANAGDNVETKTPNGDLEAAKQLQKEFSKAGKKNGGKPPHAR